MTPQQVIQLAKDNNVRIVDLKLCDIPGTWHHFSIPLRELTEEVFEDGLGFDGSSVRGWKVINASDMLVVPDPTTAFIDPFTANTTLSLTCDVHDPLSREVYDRDPRGIARKAEAYLASTGIADTAYFGPEAEFFVFDSVAFDSTAESAFHRVDSIEGIWNRGRTKEDDGSPNLGYKIRHKEGYFPVPPADKLVDIRHEMILTMMQLGIDVEREHHEVATAGQAEIDIVYDTLLRTADKLSLYKYVVKNVAHKYGKTATFMPKPLFGDNGSGMHTHQSLWRDGKPLFAGNGYAGLSDLALHYIGGILAHAPALCAFCNPTNNSYKRLVPGYEAPVNLAYSARNRSAAVRIPTYSGNPKSKRIEYRTPDPAANPYLACSAMLMAGLDGITRRLHPGDPLDKNLYDLAPDELAKVPQVPDSLRGALDALEHDHEFLTRGDVFTRDFIENFIAMKKSEYDAIRLRPHPYEFCLYFDV
ncbi:type I glutamate--ammonia ligase [Opitutales bacterium ASA1]|uniref:type I glutamate--ammonia ligase n=1 Tax=Congregicoccus parvus TaxID=3081749 RepID=UPI002B2878D2|nr:type I glutamate--ammonia ligase [Opitutales bacterium ASA1]